MTCTLTQSNGKDHQSGSLTLFATIMPAIQGNTTLHAYCTCTSEKGVKTDIDFLCLEVM